MKSPKQIKALILDMDGVLWRDDQPIGDLPKIFSRINKLGFKYVLATNNSSKTPQKYQEKLSDFGVNIKLSQIITSSMAVAVMLKEKYPSGGPVFILGEDGLKSALFDQGFYHQEKDCLAVAAGLDRTISYEKFSKATLLIRSGAKFYGTNPDKTYPSPLGLVPGAGAVLAFLQTSTGVDPIVAGKPQPYLFNLALKKMEVQSSQTISIGDRIETDIIGGRNAGCLTALVTSGVCTLEDLKKSSQNPDFIAEDLTSLLDKLER
jgi:4-nitrophenyl phosphatase